MTKADFIIEIGRQLATGGRASHELLARAAEGVRSFPDCAELWYLHGLVAMATADDKNLPAAARSFEMALVRDPARAEAQVALEDCRRRIAGQSPG
jgi:hypothetical protein